MTNHAPYRQSAANEVYHLLFADDLAAFRPAADRASAPWQATLYAEPGNAAAVRALAEDAHAESRVRLLACAWLRVRREAPPPREVLGVVVEVALEGGLDTLAAYADGGVRYLGHGGHMTIVEGAITALAPAVRDLLQDAAGIVARIGPWDKPRLPPPTAGRVRMSFLVTDGLYFGDGPMAALQQDGMAGPLLRHATVLLQQVVDLDAQASREAR